MTHRTQITHEDEQYTRLLSEPRRTELGFAELVRRAVDKTYGAVSVTDTPHALDTSRTVAGAIETWTVRSTPRLCGADSAAGWPARDDSRRHPVLIEVDEVWRNGAAGLAHRYALIQASTRSTTSSPQQLERSGAS